MTTKQVTVEYSSLSQAAIAATALRQEGYQVNVCCKGDLYRVSYLALAGVIYSV